MIYLDHNASSPIKPQVRTVLVESLDLIGNPSAVHQYGRVLREGIENARRIVANAVNADDGYNIIFTSGATEANMSILNNCNGIDHVLVSSIEHTSVRKSRDDLKFIPVSKDGVINIIALEEMLDQYATSPQNTLISVMMANNETGITQPVQEISRLAKKYQAIIHTDAVQGLGRMGIDMQELGVDALTISGHKIGAPQGTGVLVVKDSLSFSPFIRGGGQEKSKRAGTENSAGIIALGAAVKMAIDDLKKCVETESIRDYFEEELLKISPDSVIFGRNVERTCNTCFFATPNLDSQALVIALDMEGIAVTSGSACSSGTSQPSTVLKAMSVEENLRSSALRISFGWNNTKDDVNNFMTAWQKIYTRMKI